MSEREGQELRSMTEGRCTLHCLHEACSRSFRQTEHEDLVRGPVQPSLLAYTQRGSSNTKVSLDPALPYMDIRPEWNSITCPVDYSIWRAAQL
jgi:hypothetical protein